MSLTVLQKLKTHIAGSATGYSFRYYRVVADDTKGAGKVILLRPLGEGSSSVIHQTFDIMITVYDTDTRIQAVAQMMETIVQLLRGSTVQSSITRFDPIGGVLGPFTLDSGKLAWQLNVRAHTEDQ